MGAFFERSRLTLARVLQSTDHENWRILDRWANKLGNYEDWSVNRLTVTQGVGITLDNSQTKVFYTSIGNFVHLYAYIPLFSAGTAANIISVSGLPTQVRIAGLFDIGTFSFTVAGNKRTGIVFANGLDQLYFVCDNTANFFGIAPAVTIASGNVLNLNLIYESK